MCIKSKLPLKLITFDATNTLLKFKIPPWRYYTDVAKFHGFEGSSDDVKKSFFKSFKNMSNLHPNFGKDTIFWESWWRQVIQATFAPLPQHIEKIDDLATTLINDFKTAKCWELASGTSRLLAHLKVDKQLKLGVISNFDPRLHDILKNLGIIRQFDFITTSYDFGVSKPSPSIFEFSRETYAPLASANECLHVGDNLEKDYQGALKAGWHAVLISKDVNKTGMRIPNHHLFDNFEDFVNAVTTNQLKIDSNLSLD